MNEQEQNKEVEGGVAEGGGVWGKKGNRPQTPSMVPDPAIFFPPMTSHILKDRCQGHDM